MNKMDKDKLLFSTKPAYHFSLAFLRALRIKILLSILGGLAGGALATVIMYLWGHKTLHWEPFAVCAILTFIAASIIHILQVKIVYSRSVYHFYHNKLEYVKNFIIRELEEIKYSDITDIKLKKYPSQKKFKIGTIVLTLSNKKTFLIPDISSSDEVFHHLKKLIP